jgi:hypothetical protein
MNNFNKSITLVFIVFFGILGCSNKNTNIVQNKNISKIEISYVDLGNYLTPYAISCDYFGNNFFKDNIKKKIITIEKELNEIAFYLNETKQKNKIVKNIDVRFKMIVHYKNKKTDTICGSGNTIKVDRINYLISKKFSSLLYKITETE